jgi:hypothetical protein
MVRTRNEDTDKVSTTTTTMPPTAQEQPPPETALEGAGDTDMDTGTPTTEPSPPKEKEIKLYKSPRLKGYITVFLASIINNQAAYLSSDPIATNSVPASPTQQKYAKAVAITSAICTGILIVMHLDRYSPLQKLYQTALAPKSYIELYIIEGLLFWWFVATIVQTSVRGIAGDGKEQYNLYYSTWVCLWTMIWTLERKLCDFGYATINAFVTSWPYRAPGWIAILISCFFTLFWYVDLFLNTAQHTDRVPPTLKPFYSAIPKSQYQWLLFVATFTLLPCAVFIFVELFRESQNQVKGNLETILEGCFLAMLSLGWIPSVIVATTPGGFASLVGNAYFFTWMTTVFVMETFLWFIHDFRASVHTALQEKEKEYKRHQQQVLAKSRAIAQEHPQTQAAQEKAPTQSDEDNDDDEVDNDNPSIDLQETASPPPSPPLRFPSMDFEQGEENSVERELRQKEANRKGYFDDLNDILE